MNRNIIIAAALIFGLTVCCQSVSSEGNKSSATTDEAMDKTVKGTEKLTKDDFLVKIWNFEKNPQEWIFEGDLPCIIDFYADWCGPCRQAAPILEELAGEYAGKINIYKIDTQKEQQLTAAFGIDGLPTFLYIPKKGKPQFTSGVGRSADETKAMFKKYINEILLTNK